MKKLVPLCITLLISSTVCGMESPLTGKTVGPKKYHLHRYLTQGAVSAETDENIKTSENESDDSSFIPDHESEGDLEENLCENDEPSSSSRESKKNYVRPLNKVAGCLVCKNVYDVRCLVGHCRCKIHKQKLEKILASPEETEKLHKLTKTTKNSCATCYIYFEKDIGLRRHQEKTHKET